MEATNKSGCGPYCEAPEIELLAKRVIECYHTHLADAQITYLFRGDKWFARGKPVIGKAMVAPPLWRYVSGSDLLLILNKTIFNSLSDKGKEALVDHELAHFNSPVINKAGETVWSTRDHDVCEFSEVVVRRNICMSNLKAIADGGYEQLDLTKMETLAENVEDIEAIASVYETTEIDEEENNFCDDYEELLNQGLK